MNRRLPAICRWIFAAMTVLTLISVLAIAAVMVINPSLPPGAEVRAAISLNNMPGVLQIKTANGSVFQIKEIQATTLAKDLNPLIDVLKHYGLPLMLLYSAFFAVLFDLLRRLFRNVGNGNSFTPQTVRLVQIVGFALIGFSLVSAVGDGILSSALFDYILHHDMLTGTGLQWINVQSGFKFDFDGSYLFAGLLVLALSEVFRQGLKLKDECDLTI